MNLEDLIDRTDPDNWKLSIKNQKIDDNLGKAFACIIPFLVEI